MDRKVQRISGQAFGKSASLESLFNLEGTGFCVQMNKGNMCRRDKCGGLAQLGERLPCKQEVSGSIPLISTTHGPVAQLARAYD